MDIKLKRILLYSQDKDRLANYLADLLEMETINLNGDILLEHPNFVFLIKDKKENDSKGENNMMMDFAFPNRKDFLDFLQRIHFCNFRILGENGPLQEIEIQEANEEHYFEFTDLDQRRWKFTFEISSTT